MKKILIFAILVLLFNACEVFMGPAGPQGEQGEQGIQGEKGEAYVIERAAFTGLTTNGDSDNTTTILTLTFDMDIAGLSSDDITIIDNSGTSVVKGPVTRTGVGTYNMAVYGVLAEGSISVVVSRPAYIISPVYKDVTLFFNVLSTPSFSSIDDLAVYLEGLPENYFSGITYHVALSGLNLETDLMYGADPLRKLYNALNGKYAALDLRGCTGTFIPDTNSSVSNRPNMNRLISILLPDTLTAIGDYAFIGCDSLTSISLPASLTTIGDYAFSGNSLTSINLPASLTTIGDYAFSGCTNLTSISLPASLSTISYNVFSGCKNLMFSVYGTGPLSTDGIMLILNTTIILAPGASGSVTVPTGITVIGDYAFYSNSLTSISLPASVTTIGERAFSDCHALTSISLPASLTTIGRSAFMYCYNLTSISLPASVTTIGFYAFASCTGLVAFTCYAVTPPLIADELFLGYHPSNFVIKVPAGSVAAYKAAPVWSFYADKISAIE